MKGAGVNAATTAKKSDSGMRLRAGIRLVFIYVLLLVIAIALSVPAFIKDPRIFHILITSGVLSILAMGWVLLLRVGQFSLGQAAFLAIGSYTSSLLAIKLGMKNQWQE